MEKSYKEYLNDITTFVFDVDGVLTNGSVQVTTEGDLIRTMSVKDGYALKQAVKAGYTVCIISGGKNEGVRTRLRELGITDIYLGIDDKVEQLDEFFDIYDIKAENVLYMGDDIPDYYPMKECGVATCPKNAVIEIKECTCIVGDRAFYPT